MRAQEEREFRQFVEERLTGLRRSAYLLCGDLHLADDLVATTLTKLVRHWRKVRRVEHPTGYLRRVLVTTFREDRRRAWQRELPAAAMRRRRHRRVPTSSTGSR